MRNFYPRKFKCFLSINAGKSILKWYIPLISLCLLLASSVSVLAQSARITGRVTADADGSGIPGATVLVKGTTNGTITDIEGSYTLDVADPNSALVFSYVGYISEEILINNRSEVSISLIADVTQLEEVVVVGYGETKRKDITGSVGSMNTEAIEKTNKINAFQALQGQVPGVNIQAADNKPGGEFNIRIRGANTINSNENVDNGGYSAGQNPLFVVDGMFVNDISFLNPSDIERMDVLKDASATAIYGSRGSNGVILIQTKKGSAGGLVVQYDNYVGVKQAYNLPDMFNGPEFVQFMTDAVVGLNYASGNFDFAESDVDLTNYLRPNELQNVADGSYTDWVDLIRNDGFQTNHTLGFSGGSDRTTFGAGVAYTADEGTFEGEDYERVNIRGNINSKLSDLVTIGYSNYATFSKRNVGSLEGFRSAYRLRPTGTPYDENGEPLFFPIEGETFITNPLFEPDNMLREVRTLNYLANLSVALNLTDNLKFTSNFSPNIEFSRSGEYRGRYSKSTSGNVGNTRAEVINRNRMSYTWDNIVNYNFRLNKNHNLDAMFVYSKFMDRYENYTMQRRNLSTDEFLFYRIQTGSDVRDVTSGFSKQSLESFTGRINYSFMDRYLLTLTGRYDGASILAEDNKWAFFPSAAFAWRISDEGFMQDQNIFHDLKLRLSYGQTGNNGSGGGLVPLQSLSLIAGGFTNIGDGVVETGYVTNLPNPELTWERTNEFNFGLDFGILRNRIYGSLDIYDRKTTGIIFLRPLPIVSGYNGIYDNVGEATNKGVELALNSVNIDKGDLKWTTSLNFSRNVNEVTQLYGNLDQILFRARDANNIHQVGQPIGSAYTYVYDGIWQLDEVEEAQSFGQQPGQVKVRDLNNDGVIDADNDRQAIGANMPDWTGGLTNTVNFKNFDFSFFVYTNQGATSSSYFHITHGWSAHEAPARFNGLKTNYWTPDNPSNDWYQPGNAGPWAETMIYRDVSFVKVGYITLGYSFSESVLDALKIQNLRLYVTAQNPFVFTNYEGWDPENAGRNSYGSAYMSRTLMAGLNVKF